MRDQVRVVLDAMGGDYAPRVTVEGALAAVQFDPQVQVILSGDADALKQELARISAGGNRAIGIEHAAEVVSMDEAPASAVRSKRNNSMSVGMRLVKEGKADAFVTAGNTGAALAAALLDLGRIPGVRRPALATVLPALEGRYLLLDIGANADCRPYDLLQFAWMGHVYSKRVLGVASPRVALLSNGEEEGKGNQLVKEAFPLLKDSGLRFLGNVEGKDLPHGAADVVVTDGFTGNIVIKTAEGVATLVLGLLKQQVGSSWRGKLGGMLLRSSLKGAISRLDYAEVGGAPLLGVNGVVLVGHGRSGSKAICSLVQAGAKAAREDIVGAIAAGLAEVSAMKDLPA